MIAVTSLLLLLLAVSPLSIQVRPIAVEAGRDTSVTCIVDHRPENRKVVLGLMDERNNVITSSEVPLEGENAPKMVTRYFRADCILDHAFCRLNDKQFATARYVKIIGCED